MPADDLGVLADELQSRARVDTNGEVSWHVRDAPAVLSELAEAGRLVLSLDIRDYDDVGAFLEIASLKVRVPTVVCMSLSESDLSEPAAEGWLRSEAAAAYDALKADPSRAIPAEDVRAG